MTIKHKRGTTFRTALDFGAAPVAFAQIRAELARGSWSRPIDVDHTGQAVAHCTDDWPAALLKLSATMRLPNGDCVAAEDILINVVP